jgi:hypothetical protein
MNLKINWSAFGVAASVACAIHCAVVPLFVSSLPLLGVNMVDNIFIEVALLGVALIIGYTTLRHGFKRHHHKILPLTLFSSGILFFGLNLFISFPFSVFLFVIPGVALILSAHFLNFRLCRMADHCHASDCNH